VKEYLELYFLHVLKLLSFILTSTLGGKMKDVTALLLLSHIVFKGSKSSKVMVYIGSVSVQHAEKLISGLKYKPVGSFLQWWISPMRIRLAGPWYSFF
jgi:hypothetical protein